jgi:hypothetical protein
LPPVLLTSSGKRPAEVAIAQTRFRLEVAKTMPHKQGLTERNGAGLGDPPWRASAKDS